MRVGDTTKVCGRYHAANVGDTTQFCGRYHERRGRYHENTAIEARRRVGDTTYHKALIRYNAGTL